MGSGHILVYAYDLLIQLYVAEGFRERDAAELILEHNLFGLDIDKRAFQLTYFALMMKGRQYSRRILTKSIKPKVYAVPDNYGITEAELQLYPMEFPNKEKAYQDLLQLIDGFKEGANLGSLLEFEDLDFSNLKSGLDKGTVSFLDYAISEMIEVAEVLQQKYDISVTNPPYMGSSGFNKALSKYSKDNYPRSKNDLFAMFIERCIKSVKKDGYISMVTMQSWMFLSSYEAMRKSIISKLTINNLMHMENMVMGIAFGTAVTIIHNRYLPKFKGSYHQIKTIDVSNESKPTTVPIPGNRFNQISQDEFNKIPGAPISYWVSENIFDMFSNSVFGDVFKSAGRMKTHNNIKYVKFFWEINFISLNDKWATYHNGGNYRKWYGNETEVVNVDESAVKFYKENGGYPNKKFIKKKGVTWSLITSATNSFRLKEANFFYSSGSPTIIEINSESDLFYEAIAFLNSIISKHLIEAINPTLNTTIGDILSLPFVNSSGNTKILVEENIKLSKNDWNSFEISRNYSKHPLI